MINQDRRPDRIHVVDDGLPDGGRASRAVEHVLWAEASELEWEVTRLATNQGKRAALATGFRAAPDADIYVAHPPTFGDDRRLTNYALRADRVVLCEKARASTAVPERFGHYLRQQIRCNKSFFRESVWVLGTFPLASGASHRLPGRHPAVDAGVRAHWPRRRPARRAPW